MYVLDLDKVQNQSHSGMVNVYFSVWRMVFDFGNTIYYRVFFYSLLLF